MPGAGKLENRDISRPPLQSFTCLHRHGREMQDLHRHGGGDVTLLQEEQLRIPMTCTHHV